MMSQLRRVLSAGLFGIMIITFIFFSSRRPAANPNFTPQPRVKPAYNKFETPPPIQVPDLTGHAIASKIGNETLKAELGRAAWKLFHTTFAKFPDKPTADESLALKTYIHLFQRLYPCGECAEHFGEILKKFPPQVATRSTAAAWGCHVHNEVNKSLKKELWDCSNIGDFYDCGCAETPEEKKVKEAKDKAGGGLEKMGNTQGG